MCMFMFMGRFLVQILYVFAERIGPVLCFMIGKRMDWLGWPSVICQLDLAILLRALRVRNELRKGFREDRAFRGRTRGGQHVLHQESSLCKHEIGRRKICSVYWSAGRHVCRRMSFISLCLTLKTCLLEVDAF